MKLVIQQGTNSQSRNIEEHQVESIIQNIEQKYNAERIDALPYELARFRIPKGVAIIFHDNRRVRTRNYWFEVRGLAGLAKHLKMNFYHSVPREFEDGQRTEIDGLDIETGTIMVELKQQIINQKWIDFYEKKRNRLGLKECYVCAPRFNEGLNVPENLSIFKLNSDNETLRNYYRNKFELPKWFEPYIKDRHVRVLMNNGLWYGVRRKITKTAKHTPTSKIRQAINLVYKRRTKPVRIYYSLSRMAIPQRDYFGKGYPLAKIIASFDVDSDHKPHEIGPKGYCKKCLEEVKPKCEILKEKLLDLGWGVHIIHSGFKGYHLYCLDEDDKPVELSIDELQELLPKLKDEDGKPLTDNENFKAQDGSFDLHRIFKLPDTVDAVTGIRVIEKLERLNFKDEIHELY